MGKHGDLAKENFAGGLNCAQSVLAAFCEERGMSREDALRVAAGLGGGARAGELCGAVSGAVMAIGLRHGQRDAEDTAAKAACNAQTAAYTAAFRARCGGLACREMLGRDVSAPEDYARAREDGLFQTICPALVHTAAELLDELGM